MRTQRAPVAFSFILFTLLAYALSKPLVGYVPEHCQSYTGSMLRACIEQTKFDTAGMYTNRVISDVPATDSNQIFVDRDSEADHTVYYDHQTGTSYYDVGVSQN